MFYVANIRYCFGSTKLKMFSLPSVIYIFHEQSIACLFAIKNQEIKKSETKTRKKNYQIVSDKCESGLSNQSFCENEQLIMVTIATWI